MNIKLEMQLSKLIKIKMKEQLLKKNGLTPELAHKVGKIEKVVINTNNVYNGSRGGPSYSGYITFSNPRDSAKAILAVDQFMYNERLIRASFGTSKFC